MLNKIIFAIRNKKENSPTQEQLENLGVAKEQIISYNKFDELFKIKCERDFIFTVEENCEINKKMLDLFQELELSSEINNQTIYCTLLQVSEEDGTNTKVYNCTPLKTSSYSNLQDYLDMTTLGLIIPKEILEKKKFELNKDLDFYKDLSFYAFCLQEGYNVRIIGKILFSITTEEFNVLNREKETLDKEVKLIISNE